MDANVLTPTMEDYLEAILTVKEKKGIARVKDIGKAMGVKNPTVTSMLTTLRETGLVTHEKYEHVDFTDEGLGVAREIKRRHEVLTGFLHNILGVKFPQAEEDACKMEHNLSADTFERLVDFMEFVEICPRHGPSWLQGFETYRTEGRSAPHCLEAMKAFREELTCKIREMASGEEPRTGPIPLTDLPVHAKGRITKVGGAGPLKRRLLAMGVAPDSVVQVERVAPLGDPVEIKLRGYHLSLRREEASQILVEEV
jgi:DtxR family Mn-dependent transcriptional regulator